MYCVGLGPVVCSTDLQLLCVQLIFPLPPFLSKGMIKAHIPYLPYFNVVLALWATLVAGAWTEREKMYHGGSFLKLADDNMDIQNPEAQNRELSGF